MKKKKKWIPSPDRIPSRDPKDYVPETEHAKLTPKRIKRLREARGASKRTQLQETILIATLGALGLGYFVSRYGPGSPDTVHDKVVDLVLDYGIKDVEQALAKIRARIVQP